MTISVKDSLVTQEALEYSLECPPAVRQMRLG